MTSENVAPAATGAEGAQANTRAPNIAAADANLNQPDTVAALDFLQQYKPGGPWVLTAIWPRERRTKTATFDAAQIDAAADWIARANANGWSVYFMVNPATRMLAKKAEKTDVEALAWLHVDIDPRPGEDIDAERERALRLLRQPPRNISPPTIIIDSGGGYQGFWRLREPIAINGDRAQAEDAERYNRALEDAFGADHCHNSDRVMRLPGTVNWPTPEKEKKGRRPALARLIEFHRDRVYDRSQFVQAPALGAVDDDSAASPTEAFHKNFADIVRKHAPKSAGQLALLRELTSIKLADLDPAIDETGFSEAALSISRNMSTKPDEQSDKGRSEVCVAFAGQCLRDGMALREICSALYSPRFEAAAHVLDPKHSRDRLRPIHRAIATAICTEDRVVRGGRPAIYIKAGELPRIVDEAEAALRAGGFAVYQRGGELVRAARLDRDDEANGIRRAAGALVLVPIRATWLTEQLARAATWLRLDARSETWRPVDPDAKYANTYLARVGEWRMPILRGIVEAPTLRADFTVLQSDGYDAASGLILDKGGAEFPAIPESPTREQAIAALDEIAALFRSFPFEPENAPEGWQPSGDEGAHPSAARSVVLSAVLTGLVRRTLRTAPMHGIDAPEMGTGKSLITETIATILSGRVPAHTTQGKSPEEDEKRLVSVLRAGDPMLVIDNCEQPIEGDFLCSMLTQEVVQGRILGKSEMVIMPTNALVMATGNNLTFAGDMTRRALICRINAGTERPDERRFDFDPRAVARANRPRLVVAGLTVLRAYVAAGRPMRDRVAPIGSFEDWNVVREALVWLDQPDPALTRRRIAESDPVKERLVAIIEGWDKLGLGAMRISEVVRHLDADPTDEDRRPLREALASIHPRGLLDARKIGWHFRKIAGRVVGGRCFVRIKEGDGEAVYVLHKVNRQKTMEV